MFASWHAGRDGSAPSHVTESSSEPRAEVAMAMRSLRRSHCWSPGERLPTLCHSAQGSPARSGMQSMPGWCSYLVLAKEVVH